MKSITLLSVITICIVNIVLCQKPAIDLTFTAIHGSHYVPIDSISIENLTQNTDTVLYSPDTILSLEYQTGIFDQHKENNIFFIQNYPNPIVSKTTIEIYMNVEDRIRISIRDILGREVTNYSNRLSVGKHTFNFHPAGEMYYFLFAETSSNFQTLKMINLNHTGRSLCKLVYVGVKSGYENFKSQNATKYFEFNLNDQLRYTAYAQLNTLVNGSNIIEDTPNSSKTYVFNISKGVPCPNIPYVNYEDQIYETIQIGEQCWFKENINIGIPIYGHEEMLDNDIIEKYCYGNLISNCEVYGGLYQWDEMMEYKNEEGTKGICPLGWHIPTDNDWYILESFLDPTINEPLIFGWRGTIAGTQLKVGGSSGFDAMLEGRREHDSGFFDFFGTSHFWSSTEYLDNVIYRRLEIDVTSIGRIECNKNYGFPVRCIKDPIYDPPKPIYPIPENWSMNADTNITLHWTCNNTDSDTLFFNIYFGTSLNPPLVAFNIQDTFYTPGALNPTTFYYWKVTVFNLEGDSTNGSLWGFQTLSSDICGVPFIDERDGQQYTTVLVGAQCWMSENLNYGTMMNGSLNQSNNAIYEKYCFNNSIDSCEIYGGLYQWGETMQYQTNPGTQGICPAGWHIPSDEEWYTLENYIDPTINDPTVFGWRGINAGAQLKTGGSSGFNALLEGRREYNSGIFNFFGTSHFWSSTNYLNEPIYRRLELYNNGSARLKCSENYGFPLRCIRN